MQRYSGKTVRSLIALATAAAVLLPGTAVQATTRKPSPTASIGSKRPAAKCKTERPEYISNGWWMLQVSGTSLPGPDDIYVTYKQRWPYATSPYWDSTLFMWHTPQRPKNVHWAQATVHDARTQNYVVCSAWVGIVK